MNNLEKLSKGLTGIAGEYLVAGELSRRGYMASITLRNNDSIDIHASKVGENKIFAIQVKTNQNFGRKWTLSKKAELLDNPILFYIFVSLKNLLERPEIFYCSKFYNCKIYKRNSFSMAFYSRNERTTSH